MRKVLALVVVALLAVAVVPALAATKYRATLNGKSETPKSNSKATGSAVFTVASNGKLYSESIENIEPGPIEAIQATGANWLQVIVYAIIPQIIPPFVSFTVYRWDVNIRSSTIIGAKAPGVSSFAAAVKAIKSGKAYVNVHTKKHPAGEIRGQIKK